MLIDISALEMVDSFIGRMIANISAMSRILDAQTVVVGMQPAVAITLVELGLTLPGVQTALDVERGMELLRAATADADGSTMTDHEALTSLPLRAEQDIVLARQAVRRLTQELGFSLVDQTKMVTAASELARNTVDLRRRRRRCAGRCSHDGGRKGLRLHFVDEGPGIPDLDAGPDRRLDLRQRAGPGPVRRQAAGQRVRHRDARRARARA